jgi:hypothetical protein
MVATVRKFTWVLFWVLFLLHHDFWWWSDPTVLFGFLPIGMAWHVGFSVATAMFWLMALRYAWPSEIEHWAEQPDEP